MPRIVLIMLLLVETGHSIKMITTNQDRVLPQKGGYAQLLNSSLKAYDSVSVCGRFVTYQFTVHPDTVTHQVLLSAGKHYLLSGYVALPCGHVEPGCTQYNKDRLGTGWKYKRVLGFSNLGKSNSFSYYPVWEPGQWNSFCVTASISGALLRVNINGQTMAESDSYGGYYQNVNRNILLMNNFDFGPTPVHGAVSDLNIWSRILSEEEISAWSLCQRDLPGSVLSWSEASLDISPMLTVKQIEKSKICLKTKKGKKRVGFNLEKSFDETVEFCQRIGGNISVAKDEDSLKDIRKVFEEFCADNSLMIHSGYSDKEKEGQWVDVVSGQARSWLHLHWAQDNPSNYTNKDCAFYNVSGRDFLDGFCSELSCPVCEISSAGHNFILRGVCLESPVDTYFVMKTSSEFLGYIQSRMFYSETNARWEIVNVRDSTDLFAYMIHNNDRREFPIGKHFWHFTTGNCSDPASNRRSLNFHREVEQPGHFCCDDGTCIDSQLVCNNFADCQDRTDERNCTFLHFRDYGNDSERPPIEFQKGKIKLLNLSATFNVLNVFEVNEVESTFDIYFILEIQWNDKDLDFEFLKHKDYQNFLTQEEKKKIWTPKIYFDNARTIISSSSSLDDAEIFVLRRGVPALDSDLDSIHVNELYAGRNNPLKMVIEERVLFTCSFDNIKNFPFGIQKCSLKFHLFGAANNLSRMIPLELNDKGRTDSIGQYVIDSWSIGNEFNHETSKNIVRVTMILSRKIVSIFLVTYLPTILMNLINQITNYITGDTKYDLIYTINITCMMVLSSVYLSVSASLPPTSDIKPVEVWLIFNLAYPFLTILINVLLQVKITQILHRANPLMTLIVSPRVSRAEQKRLLSSEEIVTRDPTQYSYCFRFTFSPRYKITV